MHEQQAAALDRDAEALGRVVAELQHAQRPGRARRRRARRTHIGDADRCARAPAAPVEAAGEPHDGPLGLEDLGPGEQVLRDAASERGDADADEHEAVRRHAALPGQDVDRERGDERADERAERR